MNDLLIQLRVQVKALKTQVGELEQYEQQLTQMNGTPAARDALKDIIKVRWRCNKERVTEITFGSLSSFPYLLPSSLTFPFTFSLLS